MTPPPRRVRVLAAIAERLLELTLDGRRAVVELQRGCADCGGRLRAEGIHVEDIAGERGLVREYEITVRCAGTCGLVERTGIPYRAPWSEVVARARARRAARPDRGRAWRSVAEVLEDGAAERKRKK